MVGMLDVVNERLSDRRNYCTCLSSSQYAPANVREVRRNSIMMCYGGNFAENIFHSVPDPLSVHCTIVKHHCSRDRFLWWIVRRSVIRDGLVIRDFADASEVGRNMLSNLNGGGDPANARVTLELHGSAPMDTRPATAFLRPTRTQEVLAHTTSMELLSYCSSCRRVGRSARNRKET